MKDLALTIDCGTKGARATVFDAQGNLLCNVASEYPGYLSLEPGWCEASGEMFWDALCSVTQQLKENFLEIFQRIAAVTLACQRDTGTIVDEEGSALRNFIVWMDRRLLQKAIPTPQPWHFLFTVMGKQAMVDSFNMGTHAHWIKVNEPELWQEAKAYVLLSTYLMGRLTGKVLDCRSNIAGHLPYNYKKKEWCGPREILAQIVQIERDKLCALTDSLTVMGRITAAAAAATGLPEGLPVVGSGTDKGCETVGVGSLDPATASISLGTQATVEITDDRYYELVGFYPPFPSVKPEAYNPEITVYNGFWMIGWFIETFMEAEAASMKAAGKDIFEFLDKKLAQVPIGAGGLLLQPFWGMESFRDEARGSIIGFGEGQDKFYIYRAIIEGLGYALRDGLERIEKKSGVRVKSIGLSGGGSHSDVIAPSWRIFSDVRLTACRRRQRRAWAAPWPALWPWASTGISMPPRRR